MKHHRTDRLEAQFIDILSRLRAEPGLLEAFVLGASKSDRKTHIARLSALRAELTSFESRRRAIFEAFEAAALGKEDLKWRLDDLRANETEAMAAAAYVEEQLALDKARQLTLDAAKNLIDRAGELWRVADIDDRRALAKAISHALGKLIVRADGTLLIGNEPAVSGPEQSKHDHEAESALDTISMMS